MLGVEGDRTHRSRQPVASSSAHGIASSTLACSPTRSHRNPRATSCQIGLGPIATGTAVTRYVRGHALAGPTRPLYNACIVSEGLDAAARKPDGPDRVAAVAAWVQSLFSIDDAVPTLVGGGAVELYTGGAYRTGDLDFVGVVTAAVAKRMSEAGFERRGRHWIHERHRLFLEFPDDALDRGNVVATIRVGTTSVVVVGLEELIVDRLAAWQFWRSEIDGYNAWLLWSSGNHRPNLARLRALAERNEASAALDSLVAFARTHVAREPTHTEVETWARTNP